MSVLPLVQNKSISKIKRKKTTTSYLMKFPFSTKPKDLLFKSNGFFIKVKTFGKSMAPFFRDGDIVYLRKVNHSTFKINDFITFEQNGVLVTHRIIYKSNSKTPYFITKGDNNRNIDKKVFPKTIIGKVKKINRNGKELDITTLYFFQSMLYLQEIVKIKNLFNKNEIDFVILKGLPLHLYYEKTHPQRIYADCDILIDKTQLLKVKKILEVEGYQELNEDLSSTHKKLKDKDPEVQFHKSINGFRITFDIHLEAVFLMTQLGSLENLYPQKLIDQFSKNLLSEKKLIKIENEVFPILSKENLIIYLVLHLFHHNYTGYYRYELIKSILSSREINFDKLITIINSYKFQNFVYPVFLLLRKYYQLSVPQKVLRKIRPNKRIEKYIKQNILKIDIFSDEQRMNSGIRRFKNIFVLSTEPIYKKILIFFNQQVLYSLYFVVLKKITYYVLFSKFFLKNKFINDR